MKKKSPNNREEYSITGFSDLVSSPFFFSILILTLILGLASTFGFFQNPRKLKYIIDFISQRIFISEVDRKIVPTVVNNRAYSIAQRELHVVSKKDGNITASSLDNDRYVIFSDDFVLQDTGAIPKDAMVSVSIDYNLSSRKFWGDLSKRYFESNSVIIGSPISPYYSLDKDQFRYDLGTNHSIL